MMNGLSAMTILSLLYAMNMHAEMSAYTIVTVTFMCVFLQTVCVVLARHLNHLMASHTQTISAMPRNLMAMTSVGGNTR